MHLPRAWVASTSKVRVNLVASGPPSTSSGLLTRETIASFDWRLAIGDVELTEEELAELAAAKEPLIRLRGSWHALRATDVERALRFLERRSTSVRAWSSWSGPSPGWRPTRPASSWARFGSMRTSTHCWPAQAIAASSPFRHPRDAPRPVRLPGARSRLASSSRRSAGRWDPRRRHGARARRCRRSPRSSRSASTPTERSGRRSSSAR